MNFSQKRSPDDVNIDLTALIDVVFLLIIFFMVTTTFQAKSGISIRLPEADSQMASEEVKRVVVSVKKDGNTFFGDEKVDMKTLGEKFAEVAKSKADTLVVIRADESVAHGRVVTVMDSARSAGLTSLAIATVRKKTR